MEINGQRISMQNSDLVRLTPESWFRFSAMDQPVQFLKPVISLCWTNLGNELMVRPYRTKEVDPLSC